MEGDWTNHLSVTVCHRPTSTNRINSRRALTAVPVRRRAKTSSPSRKAFSAALCSSVYEETLSSSDKTASTASSTLASSGNAIVHMLAVVSRHRHIRTAPVAAAFISSWDSDGSDHFLTFHKCIASAREDGFVRLQTSDLVNQVASQRNTETRHQ